MWILEIFAEVFLTFFDVPWSRKQWYAQVLSFILSLAACFLVWYFLLG